MGEGTAKLIEGADLDVVLQEPLKKTMEMMEEKAQESRSKHQAFRSTLLVEEIKIFEDQLDQPREEIAKLIQEKEEGDKLVGKSQKEERKVLETMSKENSEHGITCLPPQNPEFLIGIEEEPLLKLKMEVLKDGASTLELTGLPRSGKATLVRKFGSDDRVKGKRMRYFAFHRQKMMMMKKKKKKKVVMVPPKRGSIKRRIFSAIFNFMANMISHFCCSSNSN